MGSVRAVAARLLAGVPGPRVGLSRMRQPLAARGRPSGPPFLSLLAVARISWNRLAGIN